MTVEQRIKIRVIKKSANPIPTTIIAQIISFALKTVVLLITLYLLGLDSIAAKILAGAGLVTIVIGFTLNKRCFFNPMSNPLRGAKPKEIYETD